MINLIQVINTICSGENSRRRPPLRYRSVLIALPALAWFALAPQAHAACQDACLTNDNTVQGDDALISLTSGIHNTAFGYETLFLNTTGFNNTAIGWEAMNNTTTGTKNAAVGCDALDSNTTGTNNTASGTLALFGNSTGSNNPAVGYQAGSVTTGSANIDIGNRGVSGESNTIRIGAPGAQANTFIAGIRGATVADGITVVVGSDGHLGMVVSSERYKDAIQPMDKASEAILALRPVTFRYKHELDPNGIPQFGLTAEQVEKVNPDLVVRDDQGKPYTVRYEAVNAMLLNEFLKEHRKVETQEKKVQQLETTVTRLEAALKEQAAQIQDVNEKVELGKPASRMVTND
jgi:hypothetical protein